jgi:hypothetical protein
VPVEDRRWEALDPPARRQRTIDALRRLLLRESQVQPLLVVFEDLHWVDTETQAVLDRLVESLPTARLLLLVNYRPEYRHGWGGKTYYRQLRLDPLAPENATALLETLLGGEAALEPLKRLLLARTEGNPLFLEESVRSLVDDGGLVGERGAYRLVKTPDTIHVPATVQAILAARIDRLAPEDKDLLQTAAVVGTDDAMATARRAHDLAHRQKERGNEAWVLRLLGEIAAHSDPPDRESAQEHYTRALARADELGMRPLAAHCHLGLAQLYRGAGGGPKAEEHRTTAATMYREMGMDSWADRAGATVRRPG